MAMLGKLDYSKFAGYQELAVDFTEGSTDIEASEIKFTKSDDGVTAFFAAKKISGLFKADEMAENTLCYMTIHKSEYEVYSRKEQKRVKTQPTPYEVLVLEFFETEEGKLLLAEDAVFAGKLATHSGDSTLSAIRRLGEWTILFDLQPLEESSLLKEVVAGSGGKKGYNAGQKESDKLNDRRLFLLKQLGIIEDISIHEAVVFLQAEAGGSWKPKVESLTLAVELIDMIIV
jgi:hypothetical protein